VFGLKQVIVEIWDHETQKVPLEKSTLLTTVIFEQGMWSQHKRGLMVMVLVAVFIKQLW